MSKSSAKRQRHRDDLLEEALSQAAARRRFDEWIKVDDHRDALHALVMAYDDEDAETLLEIVRGMFWSEP